MTYSSSERVKVPLEVHCRLIRRGDEEDWKKEVQRIIENSLYYFVKCPHCAIEFFIEEAVDRGFHYGISQSPFVSLKCPICDAPFQLASINRVKLTLERVVEENERLTSPATQNGSDTRETLAKYEEEEKA